MDSNKSEFKPRKAKIYVEVLSAACVLLIYLALFGGVLKVISEQAPKGPLDVSRMIPVVKQQPTEIYVQSCPACADAQATQENSDE